MAFELVETGSATPVYKRFCGCTGQHVAPFDEEGFVSRQGLLRSEAGAIESSREEARTLENPFFDEQPAFFIDEGRFIPYRAISYGNALVAYEIGSQLGTWSKSGQGGRVISSQGAFIFGTDVRMPDVAYTPRDTDREVDKLSGRGSKRSDLDRKMRNEYFQNGVKLGWLVDPRPDCHAMYVYYLDNDNQVQCSANSAWRDLDGGDVLPGFRITSTSLERVLNQDSGSSSSEEVDLTCQLCDQQFTAVGRLTAHLEWHRGERADQKYLAKQKCFGI